MLRLNLGCGNHRLPQWVNADVAGHNADIEFDMAREVWPIDSGSVGALNMSHVLEHFHKPEAYVVLGEARRVLRMGARLTLAVPDLDKFIAAHLANDFSTLGGYQWTNLNDLMGGGAQESDLYNRHRQAYCFESLAYMLITSGFTKVKRREFESEIDNPVYRAISLYIEANA